MKKIFIDGSAGTTGLRIRERILARTDLELISLPEELRKDVAARKDAINNSDVAFLCLPDAAAIEAASLVENPNTVVIDTSTAHRVNPDWEYGFPELGSRRELIKKAKRIANPGCHASGFIALIEPLVKNLIILPEDKLCAFSLTGYSGGGKKMIASYDDKLSQNDILYFGGRQYALGQAHKHLPEMMKVCGLSTLPIFSPIVVPHHSGMQVTVQIHNLDIDKVKECYRQTYSNNGLVKYVEDLSDEGFISSANFSGRDDMAVTVCGTNDRALLIASFDNLGKGASGAAIQNMNLALGVDEFAGLVF